MLAISPYCSIEFSRIFMLKITDESQLVDVVAALEPFLEAGAHFRLVGPLGAGKTTFVRHLLKAWGYDQSVVSPTYNLMHIYEFEDLEVVHIDCFRLNPGDRQPWSEAMLQRALVFVEWSEKAKFSESFFEYELKIDNQEDGSRIFSLEKNGKLLL